MNDDNVKPWQPDKRIEQLNRECTELQGKLRIAEHSIRNLRAHISALEDRISEGCPLRGNDDGK
jgi:hypothetical protein